MLEEPIQVAEIKTVINSLKKNKSPGSNGLTGEFYFLKKIQEQLVEFLQRVFS